MVGTRFACILVLFTNLFLGILVTTACGEKSGNTFVPQKCEMSSCGGFPRGEALIAADSAALTTAEEYCAAEVLSWTYDSENEQLTLLHTRLMASCSDTYTMALTQNGTQEYALSLDIQQGYPPADCMCIYDVRLVASQIPEGVIVLHLGENSVSLDLSQSQGEISRSTVNNDLVVQLCLDRTGANSSTAE